MRVVEQIEAFGHPNITGQHRTTFEFTTAKTVTQRGDCVIGVLASKGAIDLHEDFRHVAQQAEAKITVLIEVNTVMDIAVGRGDPGLTFTHASDLVARKSTFTCPRTLMVGSDKAAIDLSRALIHYLQEPSQRALITLIAEC